MMHSLVLCIVLELLEIFAAWLKNSCSGGLHFVFLSSYSPYSPASSGRILHITNEEALYSYLIHFVSEFKAFSIVFEKEFKISEK